MPDSHHTPYEHMLALDLPRFRYQIKNTYPIELSDFSNSLDALGDEYKHHVQRIYGSSAYSDAKLYVREVQSGSITADVVAFAIENLPLLFPVAENVTTLVTFSEYIRRAYKYLTNRSDEKPAELDRRSYENLSKMVEPVAKDGGATINLGTIVHGNIVNNIFFDSRDANVAQNIARRDIAQILEPVSGLKENKVMYWHQARNVFGQTAGDRGIIESISKNPVKVVFFSDDLKRQMLYQDDPFRHAHVVDVIVESVQGRPALYNVVAYHGRLDEVLNEDDDAPDDQQ